MATTNEYLNQLQKDKQNLVDNLNTMGVESYDNETFTDLTPKVLEVKGKLQTKTTKASELSDVIVNPDTGFDGMSQVTVSKIVADDINNLEASNIKRGTTILGVEGTFGPTSQVKNAVPSTSAQVIVPDEGIEFMSAVNLAAVTSSIDSDIKSENIKSGIDILGVMGTFAGDINIQENKDIIPTTSQQEILADEGFNAMAKVTVNAVDSSIDNNIQPANIRKGVRILSVEGSYEPEPNQEKRVSARTSDIIVTPDDGFGGLSKVTVNAVTSSIDSDIKPENIKTGVNILGVSGNLPEFIPESIIINPTTEQQIITPTPGKTAITNITVSPVTSEIDVNIQPENIKVNKTILGIMGEYAGDDVTLQEKEVTPSSIDVSTVFPDEGYNGMSRVIVNPVPTDTITITPTQETQTISREGQLPLSEVIVNGVTSNIDSNIKPENIKQNMSILGVVGTYVGDIQTYFGPLTAGSSSSPGVVKSLIKIPDTVSITGTSGLYLFAGCSSLIEYPKLDYSNITNGNYMFYNCSGVQDFHLINNSFGSLLSGEHMFNGCQFLSDCNLTFDSMTSADSLFNGVNTMPNNITVTLPKATVCTDMFRVNPGTADTITIFLGSDIPYSESVAVSRAPLRNIFDTRLSRDNTVMYLNSIDNKDIYIDGRSILNAGTSGSGNPYPVSKLYIGQGVHITNMESFCGDAINQQGGTQYLEVDITDVTSMKNCFYRAGIVSVNFLGSADNLVDVSSFTYNNTSIRKFVEFTGIPNLGKAYTAQESNYSSYSLDLNRATGLTHDSLMNVINGLYDLNLTYNVAGGGILYTQKLILGSTNLAKLTEDEIAIATAKGWTVS